MDFTKITPVEYNGQRVAPTAYLIDYVSKKCGVASSTTRTCIVNASAGGFLKESVDKFKIPMSMIPPTLIITRGNHNAVTNAYTKSGVLKLSNYHKLAVLKDFAAQYFDTDALPATEPAAVSEVTEVETPDVTELIPVEWSAQRVLTTEQLAQFYETDIKRISENFSRNQDKFVVGKHYFKLDGEELKHFRNYSAESGLLQINKNTPTIYLWTERGAARHAKILTTEKAWQVFELLEDNYFNAAKPVEPATPFDYEEAIDKAIRIKDKIRRFVGVGVKDEMLLAQAVYMTEKFFNQDLSAVRNCIPAATHKIGYMNATEVGAKVGKSNREINKLAVEKGAAVRDDKGVLRLTELGKKYGESVAFEKNGHSDYQIKWNDDAVAFFADNTPLFN